MDFRAVLFSFDSFIPTCINIKLSHYTGGKQRTNSYITAVKMLTFHIIMYNTNCGVGMPVDSGGFRIDGLIGNGVIKKLFLC